METKTYRILSIDAWRTSDGDWQWNVWYKVGEISTEDANKGNRKLLAYMRNKGFLSAYSAGKLAVEGDDYNLVILKKGTRQPLFAIEYED